MHGRDIYTEYQQGHCGRRLCKEIAMALRRARTQIASKMS